MVTSSVLSLFDQSHETVVSADASSYGLGVVLLRRQPDGELKSISYISLSLTHRAALCPYRELALAFTCACECFSDFFLGMKFHILTDNKTLVPLFGGKNLDEMSLRIQCFCPRIMLFKFTISHVPGRDLLMADALSRAPCGKFQEEDILLEKETAAYACQMVQSLPAKQKQIAQLKRHQEEDK